MSLYKRKDSPVWWVKLSNCGRTVQKSTGTTKRREAQEVHDLLVAQLWKEVKLGVKPSRIWDEAVLRWLEEKAHKKSIETDRFYLRWLQPHLQGMKLETITRDVIENLIFVGIAAKVQNSTVNRRIALVRSILRKACDDWEWIEKVPKFRLLHERKGRVRFLTHEEAKRLLDALPPHLQAMAAFSLCTGLRQGNVKNLRWSKVDLAKGFAWVEAHEAKGGRAIPVPLTTDAVNILRTQVGGNTEFVFHYLGKRITQVGTKAWRAALQRAGIEDFRWHDLRHTWASWHVQHGTPLYALQEMGAWSDVAMVQRYAHLTPAHLAAYANRLAEQIPSLSLQITTFNAADGYDLATLQPALMRGSALSH